MRKICVLGSGAWGTAIASLLADNGNDVCIYGICEDELNDLKLNRQNKKYYGEKYLINENIFITDNFEEGVRGKDLFVIAVPSFAIKETVNKLLPYINDKTIIVNLAKGFDSETQKTIGQYTRELLPIEFRKNVVSLLGPTFATEVAEKQITAITASSIDISVSKTVEQIFTNDYFKVFASDDPVGCEYCAALKNIIALACGIADGMGYKVNTKAAIITEGLKEIEKFVTILGGNKDTCYGLAGIGDLYLTCSSTTSRNYSAGVRIGQTSYQEFTRENTKTVEGVFACKIAKEIAVKSEITCPIIESIYNIAYCNASIIKEIEKLKNIIAENRK